MARVHYWELSNYNSGRLVGKWFDLDGLTKDEHIDELQDWLEEIHKEHIEELEARINVLKPQLYHFTDVAGRCYRTKNSDVDAKLKRLKDNLEYLQMYAYEEWILGDTEDVPSQYVGEYGIDSEYFDWLEAVESSQLGEEVFEAAAALGIPFDSVEDSYRGEFKDDEDLAYEEVESGCLLEGVPDTVKQFFDYKAFGYALSFDYAEHNGHYFYH